MAIRKTGLWSARRRDLNESFAAVQPTSMVLERQREGRPREKIRCPIQDRIRCHPRINDATRKAKAPYWIPFMTNSTPQEKHDELGPFAYRDGRRLLILVVLLIVGWLLLRALVPVLLLFGIVILLAMVLNPLVVYLERRRIPRPIGVALVLIALAAIAILVVAVAVPTFADQLHLLVRRLPGPWQSIRGHIADFAARDPAVP